MELRHLRAIVALADEGRFTAAARKLHVAQPALSQQIRRIEAEVGLPLVDRTTRHVALTEAGQILVDHARRILAAADAARADLDELAGLRRGHLRIGATLTLGPVELSEMLARFHRANPGVELAVQEDLSASLVDSLRRDAVDLALIAGPIAEPPDGIEVKEIARDRLVAVLPANHHLAGRTSIRVADLRHDVFATFRAGATIRTRMEATARDGGFTPTVAFESDNVMRILALVSAGLAVTILPAANATVGDLAIAAIPLRDRDMRSYTVHLAWRAQRHWSPSMRAFAELSAT